MSEADLAAPEAQEIDADEALMLHLDAFEGPLHMLLELARDQKVDLAKISVSALADQYLTFIDHARAQQIDLAADYLVMAAWLTYLKSRMLLPKPEKHKDELTGDELAALLKKRLEHLEQARSLASRLWDMPQLERDVFLRGERENVVLLREPVWKADLMEMVGLYARQRITSFRRTHHVKLRPAYPLEDARRRLETLLEGQLTEWRTIQTLTPPMRKGEDAPPPPSYIASLLGAALELVRDGRLEIRKAEPFAPVYLKAHEGEPHAVTPEPEAAS
jgi:segregation and condensation protein A